MLRRLHYYLVRKSRLWMRWTTWTNPLREWSSILNLAWQKGAQWAWHTERALLFADARLPQSPFSLKDYTFRALAGVFQPDVRQVLEFGSGNSTLALWRLLETVNGRPFSILTVENDGDFYERQRFQLDKCGNVTALLAPLKRLLAAEEETWLGMPDRTRGYSALGRVETRAEYGQVGTDRMFYDFDFASLAQKKFDLVILDGPQGPGRWYAYPLLQSICHYPFTLLVDDYPMYQELSRIGDFFVTELLTQGSYGAYGFAIFKVLSPVGRSQ